MISLRGRSAIEAKYNMGRSAKMPHKVNMIQPHRGPSKRLLMLLFLT
jgi:hypothetical protein